MQNALQRYTDGRRRKDTVATTCARQVHVSCVSTAQNPFLCLSAYSQKLCVYLLTSLFLKLYGGFCRIIDQLYALQLVHRANGTSGYNIGVPVGFERDGRIFIYNHYRIIVHYHGDMGEKSSSVSFSEF